MKADRYNHITDQDLLAYHAADGNTEWLGVLLQRYTLLLFGVCMKYLKDETEARDTVQQIFLKVLTEVPKYRIEYFKSWLYMVAKNHCLMRLRERGGKAPTELSEALPAEPEADRTERQQHEETFDLLEEALKELNQEQRRCVTLFYLRKLSYQQISQQSGFSFMQVKSHIQNGKRNLKIILERKRQQRHQR